MLLKATDYRNIYLAVFIGIDQLTILNLSHSVIN